jgi:DNA polymerase I
MRFQLIDCDYVVHEGSPVIRLFGRSESGESVCCLVFGFEPYFYVEVDDVEGLKGRIEKMQYVKRVEVVERYKPIGYQKSKTNMLKVYTFEPKNVPQLREHLKDVEGIVETYETDILFRYRFMIDNDLRGMDWVEVEPQDDVQNIAREFTDGIRGRVLVSKRVRRLADHKNAPLKFMSFDIECLPSDGAMPSPEKSPIIMIGMCFDPPMNGNSKLILLSKKASLGEGHVVECDDEVDMLKKFVDVVNSYDPDVLMGYNSNDFDIPYILDRMKYLRKKYREDIHFRIGRDSTKDTLHRRFGYMTTVNVVGRVIADGLHMVRRDYALKQYTLREVAKELLDIEKLDLPPEDMEKAWNDSERLKEFTDYCLRDAELAMKIVLGLIDKYFALSRVSGILPQDVIERGQTVMVERLLLRAFMEDGRVMHSKPEEEELEGRLDEGFEGAAVLDPVKGLHENVVVLDYRSLYPSIIMAHNICYSTLLTGGEGVECIEAPNGVKFVVSSVKRGIVPRLLEGLLEERDKVRELMQEVSDNKEYNLLNAKQNALKILLNSFYGYYGHPMARLYVPDIAAAVTSFGRENILRTRHMIEDEIGKVRLDGGEYRLKVVYGDTDSVFVKIVGDGELSLEELERIGVWLSETVSSKLPPPMELKLEAIAKRALFIAKKRYALWAFRERGEDFVEELVVKGMETIRRDWCELTSNVVNRVIELVLKEGDINGAVEYVRQVIRMLKGLDPSHDPELFEQLILTRRYTKQAKKYKNKQPHITVVEKMEKRGTKKYKIGDRIPFVIVAGKGLLVERAEDPDYARGHNLPIDTDYYINKQILPPVLRILEMFSIDENAIRGLAGVEAEAKEDKKQMSLTDFM